MICPYCGSNTKVTNSRSRAKNTQIWRRRQCTKCASIWTTHEQIDPQTSHKVLGNNNSLEPFYRDKLFISIKDSLQHRKTATNDSTALTDTILRRILALKSPEITKIQIMTITYDVLVKFDPTAASVYKAKYFQ